MPRTRDLTLILVVVAFLAIAIGATVLRQLFSVDEPEQSFEFTAAEAGDVEVRIVDPNTLDREARLSEMREKVSAAGPLVSAQPEPETETVVTANNPESPETEPEVLVREVFRCPGYQTADIAWSPFGIAFEAVEGALLVYREVESEILLDPATATSSTQLPPTERREVIVQLPVRSIPESDLTCLSSDIVGIAQDGSLIRNDEAALYGVFGPETQIGFALDGFPIYGNSSAPTDSCGGMMTAGGYQYHLSSERETVLNCFSATPVSL